MVCDFGGLFLKSPLQPLFGLAMILSYNAIDRATNHRYQRQFQESGI